MGKLISGSLRYVSKMTLGLVLKFPSFYSINSQERVKISSKYLEEVLIWILLQKRRDKVDTGLSASARLR